MILRTKKIQLGILLFFSSLFVSNSTLAEDWVYSVRPGDTLWSLCIKYTTKKNCWQEIGPYNGVEYPKTMAPGTRIKFPVEWLKLVPAAVEIVFIHGEAFIYIEQASSATGGSAGVGMIDSNPNSKQFTRRPAKLGDNLNIGMRIETEEDSSATLKFADGTLLTLEENSELNLDTLSSHKNTGMVDSRVNLKRGSAKAIVPKRVPVSQFRISSPSAIAAVRGTHFRVSSIKDSEQNPITINEVYEGLVGVRLADDPTHTSQVEVQVKEGFGIRAEKGQVLSQPTQLLTTPSITTGTQAQIHPLQIEWETLEGAEQYRVEILSDNDREELLFTDISQEPKLTVEKLPNACFLVRVRGIDAQQFHGRSSEQRICATNALPSPVIDENSLSPEGDQLSLSWNPISEANKYLVETSYTEDFETIEQTKTFSNTSGVLTINPRKNTYVRVIAIGNYDTRNPPSESILNKAKNKLWIVITAIASLALAFAL